MFAFEVPLTIKTLHVWCTGGENGHMRGEGESGDSCSLPLLKLNSGRWTPTALPLMRLLPPLPNLTPLSLLTTQRLNESPSIYGPWLYHVLIEPSLKWWTGHKARSHEPQPLVTSDYECLATNDNKCVLPALKHISPPSYHLLPAFPYKYTELCDRGQLIYGVTVIGGNSSMGALWCSALLE